MAEVLDPSDLFLFETQWLEFHVKAGIFNPTYLELLNDVHREMAEDMATFSRGVNKFIYRTLYRNLSPDHLGEGVNIIEPKIYVARIVVNLPEENGVGLNIVFAPNDPAHHQVAELYQRNIARSPHGEIELPFGVLWADGYYFQGLCYKRGEIEGDISDSGSEVFDYWELVWAQIHANAVIFRLGAPFISQPEV